MRNRVILECRAPAFEGPIMSLFSFSVGGPVNNPRQSDLCFYFDSDDCRGGALVGHHDEKGWLFPIGKRDWRELQRERPPSSEVDSTTAITPMTTAQERVAFWAKTVDGRYALVRIAKVQPSSYDAIKDGKKARIEFEWTW